MNGHKPQQPQPKLEDVVWGHLLAGNAVLKWRKEGETAAIVRVFALRGDALLVQYVQTGLVGMVNWQDVRALTQCALDIAQDVPRAEMVQ